MAVDETHSLEGLRHHHYLEVSLAAGRNTVHGTERSAAQHHSTACQLPPVPGSHVSLGCVSPLCDLSLTTCRCCGLNAAVSLSAMVVSTGPIDCEEDAVDDMRMRPTEDDEHAESTVLKGCGRSTQCLDERIVERDSSNCL